MKLLYIREFMPNIKDIKKQYNIICQLYDLNEKNFVLPVIFHGKKANLKKY